MKLFTFVTVFSKEEENANAAGIYEGMEQEMPIFNNKQDTHILKPEARSPTQMSRLEDPLPVQDPELSGAGCYLDRRTQADMKRTFKKTE